MLVSSLLVAFLAVAPPVAEPTMECTLSCQPIKKACVCPAPKPKKKIVKRIVKPVVPQKQEQKQEQSQQVIIQITASEPRVYTEPKKVEEPFPVGIGLRGAVGLWSCNPNVFGLVGLRGRILPAHLGLEINTQFYWGHSVQAMVYPVQGPLAWHLDVGGLWFYRLPFSAQDVPRRWDLLVGTGLEWNFFPHLSLTADWRMTMPNPFDMNRMAWPDANGRHLNTGNVVGNSFLRSQVMIGLMVHTW